ncbi:hypothetical protein HK096_008026 [Nowakowskiella sp. JEL0078]|nr:hypothetical protein HK096_008026 [Nowakowskiella sp. JEL0078]
MNQQENNLDLSISSSNVYTPKRTLSLDPRFVYKRPSISPNLTSSESSRQPSPPSNLHVSLPENVATSPNQINTANEKLQNFSPFLSVHSSTVPPEHEAETDNFNTYEPLSPTYFPHLDLSPSLNQNSYDQAITKFQFQNITKPNNNKSQITNTTDLSTVVPPRRHKSSPALLTLADPENSYTLMNDNTTLNSFTKSSVTTNENMDSPSYSIHSDSSSTYYSMEKIDALEADADFLTHAGKTPPSQGMALRRGNSRSRPPVVDGGFPLAIRRSKSSPRSVGNRIGLETVDGDADIAGGNIRLNLLNSGGVENIADVGNPGTGLAPVRSKSRRGFKQNDADILGRGIDTSQVVQPHEHAGRKMVLLSEDIDLRRLELLSKPQNLKRSVSVNRSKRSQLRDMF